MRKINQKEEKRQRNEEYAKKFEKKRTKSGRKGKGIWTNWCRTPGHPASCQCVYPKRSEIPVGRS